MNMNRNEKAALAEAKVIGRFAELRVPVFTPMSHAGPVDFIALVDGEPLKVQVKFGRYLDCGAIEAKFVRNTTMAEGYNVKHYDSDDLDVYGVYSSETDRVYVIPFEDAPKTQMRLRVEEPDQTPRSDMTWAEDYELRTAQGLSSIAQQWGSGT